MRSVKQDIMAEKWIPLSAKLVDDVIETHSLWPAGANKLWDIPSLHRPYTVQNTGLLFYHLNLDFLFVSLKLYTNMKLWNDIILCKDINSAISEGVSSCGV